MKNLIPLLCNQLTSKVCFYPCPTITLLMAKNLSISKAFNPRIKPYPNKLKMRFANNLMKRKYKF